MALINKLNAIGDAIRAKTGGTDKMTLDQMPDEIASITTGDSGEVAVHLTGDCSNACTSPFWNTYLNEKTTSSEITSAKAMFESSLFKEVPFDINLKITTGGETDCSHMFTESLIRTAPEINGKMGACAYMFSECMYLRTIPEGDLISHRYNSLMSTVDCKCMFNECYSLREIPASYIKDIYPWSDYSSSIYYYGFNGCYALNKIENLPVYTKASWSSNAFISAFTYCSRLNKITFATQADGTPYSVNWKGQTIDLSKYVGYAQYATNVISYNSGITYVKEVYGSDYQDLKNDPDWYTSKKEYSRYNHDSAVNTINSLPDTSAYIASNGGTNTIKFTGLSGRYTDGGAINTLTPEEIAVATEKGWTVTLV